MAESAVLAETSRYCRRVRPATQALSVPEKQLSLSERRCRLESSAKPDGSVERRL